MCSTKSIAFALNILYVRRFCLELETLCFEIYTRITHTPTYAHRTQINDSIVWNHIKTQIHTWRLPKTIIYMVGPGNWNWDCIKWKKKSTTIFLCDIVCRIYVGVETNVLYGSLFTEKFCDWKPSDLIFPRLLVSLFGFTKRISLLLLLLMLLPLTLLAAAAAAAHRKINKMKKI